MVNAVERVDVRGQSPEAEQAVPDSRRQTEIRPDQVSVTSRQNVVIIQPWIRLGGAELVSVQLAYQLGRMGHSAAIACAFLDLEGLPDQAKRLQYHLPPPWLADRMRKSRVLFLILCPWVLLALVWKHSKGATILNPHNFPSMWVASIVGTLRRIPAVWYCNEPPTRVPLRDALRIGLPDFLGWFVASSWLDRLFVRGIADICVPSTMTQLQAQERYEREVKVLYVGVDADFFRSNAGYDPRSAFRLEGKHVLLCVGKLYPQKNQIVCLEALREVVRQIPNAVLLLAGDGPSALDLKSLAKRWSLEKHVLFLGQVDSLTTRQLFQACDVNLVPAVNQSWGFTAFEALCSGKVSVVSTSAGGATEILGQNRIGLVSEPTGQAFARAVIRLHRERNTYRQLSTSGQDYVLRHLTWQAFARKTVDIFAAEVSKPL